MHVRLVGLALVVGSLVAVTGCSDPASPDAARHGSPAITNPSAHTESNPTASGGLTASTTCVVGSFGQCTYPPAYITSFNASGSTITVTDDGGHTGTISLSGAVASGGLTASTTCVVGSFGQCTYPPAYIVAINASGSSITIGDDGSHTGTTTLAP
jgi:hypothetical protein